jgi:single-stranded DNA-binding protein
MIDGLIGGKLHGKPAQRVGQSGKAFVTAKVRTPTANGETMFVNVIAFSESVGISLMTLDDGDSVSISGALTPKAWTDRNGEVKPALDMVAHALLTTYHVTRKRQAMSSKPASTPANVTAADADFPDVPF